MSRDHLCFSILGGFALAFLLLAWCEPEPGHASDSIFCEGSP